MPTRVLPVSCRRRNGFEPLAKDTFEPEKISPTSIPATVDEMQAAALRKAIAADVPTLALPEVADDDDNLRHPLTTSWSPPELAEEEPQLIVVYKERRAQLLGIRFFSEADVEARGGSASGSISVIVAQVAGDGAAHGLVRRGERLVSIDGVAVRSPSHAAEALRQGVGELELALLPPLNGFNLFLSDGSVPPVTLVPSPIPRGASHSQQRQREADAEGAASLYSPSSMLETLDLCSMGVGGAGFGHAYGSPSLGEAVEAFHSLQKMWYGDEPPPQGNAQATSAMARWITSDHI